MLGIVSKGALNRLTYVIRDPSEEYAGIALADFEPNDLSVDLYEDKVIVQFNYEDRLLHSLSDYYNEQRTKDKQLIDINPAHLSEEMARSIHFIEITDIDIAKILKQINNKLVEQKNNGSIVDKRLVTIYSNRKLFCKTGMVLVKLREKNLIAAAYPNMDNTYTVYA